LSQNNELQSEVSPLRLVVFITKVRRRESRDFESDSKGIPTGMWGVRRGQMGATSVSIVMEVLGNYCDGKNLEEMRSTLRNLKSGQRLKTFSRIEIKPGKLFLFYFRN